MQGRIEPTIRAILSSFLTVIDCERCQILLTDTEEGEGEDEGREGMFRQQEKLLMHRRRGQRRETGGASKVLFRRVFDLQRSDLDEEGNILGEEESSSSTMGSEGRFPINVFITGEVAATGKKINIRDARTDERYRRAVAAAAAAAAVVVVVVVVVVAVHVVVVAAAVVVAAPVVAACYYNYCCCFCSCCCYLHTQHCPFALQV